MPTVTLQPEHQVNEPPETKATSRRAMRREQILEVAAECFAANSFAGSTLEEVAQRADLSRMMLYRYFESKEGIYLAVLDQVATALIAQLTILESPVSSDAVTRIHYAVAEQYPAGYRLFWEQARAEGTFRSHAAELVSRIHDVTTELLSRWVDLGELSTWASTVATRYSVVTVLAFLDSRDELDAGVVEEFSSHGLSGIVTAWAKLEFARSRSEKSR